MSNPGTPPVQVNVETPPDDPALTQHEEADARRAEELGELRGRIDEIASRIEALPEDTKQWVTQQLQEMKSSLENLTANATTGMENLAAQFQEIRDQVQALLTRSSPEPQPEIPNPPEVSPPEQPPEAPQEGNPDPNSPPSEGGEGPERTEQQPRQSAPTRRPKRVI